MKRILRYAGSKWRIADWVIAHFPDHKVYLEPFFGSGAIFFNKAYVNIETINDINCDIVNLFKVCRENPEELARLISLTPFSRTEFINALDTADNNIESARRTLVRYWQSFATCNKSKTSWKNSQTANSPNNAKYWNQLPENIFDILEELKCVQIENKPAIELIERYNDPNTLIYLDPPYLLNIRSPNLYKYEMSEEDHINLLQSCKRSNSKIVISAYDSELYNDMLSGWSTDTVATTAQNGAPRIEKLYINFPYNNNQLSMFDLINEKN